MTSPTNLDSLFEPLGQCLDEQSARQVADLRVAAVVQEKLDLLAERANDGVLTPDERAEYEALVNAVDFIDILKLKARQRLLSSGVGVDINSVNPFDSILV
ncbi:MAG: hypothetical protein NTZ56_23550 [Acidobacteria bacterium]|nr:hypothetical protein [Acidobacteriota bacterium]